MGRVESLVSGRARLWVTRDVEELAETVTQIAELGARRVILCGGDGTFMSGVTALQRVFPSRDMPSVIFAPAGTVATVAKNFGHRSDLLSTIQRAVATGALPPSMERPTLRIAEQGGETRIGFMFGTGLVARFFDRYYAAGGDGYGTAARIVARIFVGSVVGDAYSQSVLEPLPCTVSVEGRELEPRGYSLIMSSVVKNLGLHMLVNYRAGEDPERPHLVASPLGTRQLGPQAPRVLLGRPLAGEGIFDDLVQSFTVRFPGEDGPYVLDGDVLRAREVTVSAGPRVRVITY